MVRPNRNVSAGDFNYDRVVSLQDFNSWAIRFASTTAPLGVEI
jgi:hypothetical protein